MGPHEEDARTPVLRELPRYKALDSNLCQRNFKLRVMHLRRKQCWAFISGGARHRGAAIRIYEGTGSHRKPWSSRSCMICLIMRFLAFDLLWGTVILPPSHYGKYLCSMFLSTYLFKQTIQRIFGASFGHSEYTWLRASFILTASWCAWRLSQHIGT